MMTAHGTARAIELLIDEAAAEQPQRLVQLLGTQPRVLAGLDEQTVESVIERLLRAGFGHAVEQLAMANALDIDTRRHVRALCSGKAH